MMSGSGRFALTFLGLATSGFAYATLECTGIMNGEQQIDGCWDCIDDIEDANTYDWYTTNGLGVLSQHPSLQYAAWYTCEPEVDPILVHIKLDMIIEDFIPITDSDTAHCRTAIKG